MEKFFDTNRKTILVVAGLGAATLAALVLKNIINKNRKSETIRPKDNTAPQHAVPAGPTKEERACAIAGINVEYEGHHLSVKTMQQIIDAVKVHAAGKYIELVKENRIQRRAKRDHLEIYISLVYDFNSKVDEIIQKAEKEVLREINISETLFEDSASYHAGKQHNELALARVFISAKLKEEFKSTKTISIEELREILRGQIELIKKAAESREDVASKLTNPVEASSILTTQIYDNVYHKYTVEEEDIHAAMLVHGGDKEIQDLWMELQSALVMLTPNEPSQEEI